MTTYIKKIQDDCQSSSCSPIFVWKAVAERLVFIFPPPASSSSMKISVYPTNATDLSVLYSLSSFSSNQTVVFDADHSIDIRVENVQAGRMFPQLLLSSFYSCISHYCQ